MSPQNFNNRLSEIFNSLDGEDLIEARKRKEDIWAKVKTKEKKKSKKPFLLLLLFGGAALLAYLLFCNNNSNNDQSILKDYNSVQELLATSQKQIIQNQELLLDREQSLDSLYAIHSELLSNYNKLLAAGDSKEQPRIIQTIIKDTVYLKEIKTEEVVIERIIRDTIIIEIPNQLIEPELLSEANENDKVDNSVNNNISDVKKAPSSIQFNFSDTNRH